MSAASTERLFRRYYHDDPSFVDGTKRFHALCTKLIPPGKAILEIGAGPSNDTSDYLARIGPLHGLDVSDEVRDNRAVVDAQTYDGSRFPYAESTFFACVSNYVIEHVARAEEHFSEVARVLQPNGVYLFRTPNLYHYVTLASRVLPHGVHKATANRLRGIGEEGHEPWPTVYQANTVGSIEKIAARAGLQFEVCWRVEAEPSYGRASPVLFYPMMLYERLVNSSERLAMFRSNIFAALRKTDPG